MTFDPFRNPINYIVLGGHRSPGFAEVRDVKLSFAWEARAGSNVSGATKLLKGRDLTAFSVRIKLFDAQDLEDWEQYVNRLRYPDTSKATTVKGLDIQHPITALYSIKAVTIKTIGDLQQLTDNSWETGLELEEYREPAVTVRKAKGTVASPKPVEADPILNSPELLEATRELERQRALNKAAGI